ncbi:MAG: uracil-DNA glycosylase [Candidatus Levybacteria bacterium]|nr:uracil-DNA glycosylase [Candidatus Levybacteria bacterium]
MDKAKRLEEIAKEIERCKVCQKGKSGKAVAGEGCPDARIVFVGEAPGRTEAATGRPFVGRSGNFLRSLIKEIGLKEEDAFITSPVKYLPDKGTPSKSDIKHGRLHLLAQLKIIDPKIIILLGKVACFGVIEEEIAINKRHGEVIQKDDQRYFVTFHPSAALRFPPLGKLLKSDFEKLRNIIKKL